MEAVIAMIKMFPLALAAGCLIGCVCAVLGVFVILKRMVFISVALSEVAACGAALGMLLGFSGVAGSLLLTLCATAVLAYPFESARIPRDAVLGVIFVCAAALSVLIVSRSGFGLAEVRSMLYGDLILTAAADMGLMAGIFIPVAVWLLVCFRPLMYSFLDRDAAQTMGIKVSVWETLFFIALGLVVAAASKTAGALLVFCYLVVAPAAGLLLSRRIGYVMALAAGVAVVGTLMGFAVSFAADLPTNQTCALVICGILGLASVGRAAARWWGRSP